MILDKNLRLPLHIYIEVFIIIFIVVEVVCSIIYNVQCDAAEVVESRCINN